MKRHLAVPALALSLALPLAACGDDKEATTDTTRGGAQEQAQGDLAAFCEGYTTLSGLQFGPPTGDPEAAVEQVTANAPEEISDQVDTWVAELQKMQEQEGGGDEGDSGEATTTTAGGASGNYASQQGPGTTEAGTTEGTATSDEGGGEGGPPSAEFLSSSAAVGLYAARNCADEQVDITAVDYEYQGIPQTLTAGTYGLVLTNEGQEWHEVIIAKKGDGVTESFEELLQLPEEEALQKVTNLGAAFAGPGSVSGTVVDLEPGEYAALCFIPVGTTGLDVQAEGPPHFTEGMVHEFTVNA